MEKLLITCLVLLLPNLSSAETFLLSSDQNVVGEIRDTSAEHEDTLVDIARHFDLGYDAIVKANPSLDRWLPGQGAKVSIPTMYVLPDAPREGLILNVGDLRLYYFPKPNSKLNSENEHSVMIFPVSLGRMDWKTPLGRTTVVRKQENPTWSPPKSIREEHQAEGEPIPETVPGGREDNPLGHYALYLGASGYLIHGTDERKSFGIGMYVTHGCVRMYPEDIQKLYPLVPVGTPVYIVNQPAKVGRRDGKLYLEVNRPLPEDDLQVEIVPEEVMAKLQKVAEPSSQVVIDQPRVSDVIARGTGIPTIVG